MRDVTNAPRRMGVRIIHVGVIRTVMGGALRNSVSTWIAHSHTLQSDADAHHSAQSHANHNKNHNSPS